MTRGLTYRDAGVDLEAGDALVDDIRPYARATLRPEVLAGIGGFGALCEIPKRYRDPVLVAGTDGVGTKLKLAFAHDRHDTIGVDLVAMSANDVLVQGAEPLFFLDYYACGRLDRALAARVIRGIARGCELAGCALIGGETAEMPDMYAPEEYDLAGFCVGVVERARIVDGRTVAPGDVLLGLASTGPHANGYTLVRRVLERSRPDATTLEALLAPTRIYVRSVLALLERVPVKAMAHITGGGLAGNVPRVLPEGTVAVIDPGAWPRPPVFDWLQREGGIDEEEMRRVFNCGVGFVLVVASGEAPRASALLREADETVYTIGRIESGPAGARAGVRFERLR